MQMHVDGVCTVMVHVPLPAQGLAWYEQAFSNAIRQRIEGQAFEYLQVGDVRIEVVNTDQKVASGPAGTVVYWKVENITQALAHLQSLGAKLYQCPSSSFSFYFFPTDITTNRASRRSI